MLLKVFFYKEVWICKTVWNSNIEHQKAPQPWTLVIWTSLPEYILSSRMGGGGRDTDTQQSQWVFLFSPFTVEYILVSSLNLKIDLSTCLWPFPGNNIGQRLPSWWNAMHFLQRSTYDHFWRQTLGKSTSRGICYVQTSWPAIFGTWHDFIRIITFLIN